MLWVLKRTISFGSIEHPKHMKTDVLRKYSQMSRSMGFQLCGMCDQQSLRSACALAQSDQSLCLSLEYPMSVKLLTEHHLRFLSLKGGCTGSSESTLVKMPHCWKSHVTTQNFIILHPKVTFVLAYVAYSKAYLPMFGLFNNTVIPEIKLCEFG